MVYVLALLFLCSILGIGCKTENRSLINRQGTENANQNRNDSFLFSLLVIILVLFAGLRTIGNDTATYMRNFEMKTIDSLAGIFHIDWAIGSNPLFNIYSIVIKSIISDNAHVFIFLSAILVQCSFLFFLRRYAPNFGFSIFLYVAFTVYAFTMAAMKQTLATALAIWTIPMFAEGKKLVPTLMILVASLVHPYVVIFLFALFLTGNVWDKKTALILGVTILISFFLEPFLETVLNVASEIGDEYDINDFTEGAGINIFRIAVYCVSPILSFIYREEIRNTDNPFYFLCINLSVIASCFIILGSFGGANMFGRMANYFDLLYCISLIIVLKYGVTNSQTKFLLTSIAILCFCFFYFMYYYKYLNSSEYSTSWFSDFYKHIRLIKLFK